MVLALFGGAGDAGAPRPPRPAGGRHADERGSQALEAALILPVVVLWLCLVLHAGVLAADLVAAQAVAREAARTAAVADDAAVRRAVEEAAGRRPVRLTLRPASPGRDVDDLVTASLEVRSRAFAALGATVWLPAEATMRVEER